MTDFAPLDFSPAELPKTVRLFPLPNLVLFPHVTQPLHVFEPRYREMLAEALDGDRLIAMATLLPGWEAHYELRPPISPYGCLGRILVHQELPGRSYNVVLAGLSRIQVVDELPPRKSFREAEAIVREDRSPEDQDLRSPRLLKRLCDALAKFCPLVSDARRQLEELLERDVPLGALTDRLAYLLDLELAEKLVLLGEDDVVCRAEMLAIRLELLGQDCQPSGRGDNPFPPCFSRN